MDVVFLGGATAGPEIDPPSDLVDRRPDRRVEPSRGGDGRKGAHAAARRSRPKTGSEVATHAVEKRG